MEKKNAIAMVKLAFETVYPDRIFDIEKEVRWATHKKTLARFQEITSDECFRELVKVVFYSGFRAETVTSKLNIIMGHLGDYKRVAAFTERDIARILADERMIKNEAKIRGCVINAKTLLSIDREFGSLRDFILSISADFPNDKDRIPTLLERLKKAFKYLGPRTGRHFLMQLGFPMVKPDVMVMRLLFRLGLIAGESDEYIDDAVKTCLEIAELADIPPIFVDELLVKVGQSEGANLCSKARPKCGMCKLVPFCHYVESAKRDR